MYQFILVREVIISLFPKVEKGFFFGGNWNGLDLGKVFFL